MRNTRKMAVVAGLLAIATSCCLLVGCSSDSNKTTGKSEYGVYYSTDVAYTITGETKVKAGADYTFTVTPAAGYDASAMVVKANGKTLTANNGTYTVAKVNDTVAIYVSGIVASSVEYVNVTFSGEHVDFTGDSQAEKGEDYTFTVVAYDGYTLGEVKNGTTVLTAGNDGVYTVEDADEDIAITATATKILALKTVAGDTPSKGGSVYVDSDNRTHLKVDFVADDKFMNKDDPTKCHYSEVGFSLTDEAWASAPASANLAIVTLKINSWGSDVSEDINSTNGTNLWMVNNGIAELGFGNMKWPGCGAAEYPEGSLLCVELAKGGIVIGKNDNGEDILSSESKFAVRNSDGFDATVMSVEFKTLTSVGTVVSGSVNVAKDELNNIYLTNAGGGKIKLDLTTILGDACKGKKVNFVVMRVDDITNKNNTFGPIAMKDAKGCSFDANLSGDGTIELDIDQMAGLAMIRVSLVSA